MGSFLSPRYLRLCLVFIAVSALPLNGFAEGERVVPSGFWGSVYEKPRKRSLEKYHCCPAILPAT